MSFHTRDRVQAAIHLFSHQISLGHLAYTTLTFNQYINEWTEWTAMTAGAMEATR